MKLLCILLPAVIMCGCQKQNPIIFQQELVEIPVEYEYSDISEYELTVDSLFDVNEENYYVYFYSLNCSHCQELKNFVIKRALERQDIYFVKGSSKDKITNNENLLINAENPGDIYILGYPSLLKISSHKCIKNIAGIERIKNEIK